MVYLNFGKSKMTFNRAYINNEQSEQTSPQSPPLQAFNCPAINGNSKLTICPGDVMTEDVALTFPPCTDTKKASDARKSKVTPSYGRTSYMQGETISVTMTMFDGNGHRKSVGGDHLRARLVGDDGRSTVTGTVFDHDNGTYTALFEALFQGEITVDVVLAYTRETITSMYHIRTLIPGTRYMKAEYVNGPIRETCSCHTIREKLDLHREVCNFTLDNSGMPWYCLAPRHRDLLCQDWWYVRMSPPVKVPFTGAEENLFTRTMMPLSGDIKLKVYSVKPNVISSGSTLVPCSKYNTTQLWYRREPTGYLYEGTWHLRHCKAKQQRQFKECLRNRNIMLFGDSTVRQWYSDLSKRFNCSTISEEWKVQQWHKPSKCHNDDLNLTVEWLMHSLPLYPGYSRLSTFSIDRKINEDIAENDNVIVLIHMYMHVLYYRHDVFEIKMKRIRQSIDRLLARNKIVKVFIKGPHTFKDTVKLTDYFGYLYRQILFNVFVGLYDKVVYLDHKDITNALQIKADHPPGLVVSTMVDQMLSYIC